jgi:HD-like signal output (HDOD) protein
MKPTKVIPLLLEKIQSPTATLNDIAELIQMDKRLSDRVISLVNRSYCSAPEGVADVFKALHYIGMTTLIQLLLTTGIV